MTATTGAKLLVDCLIAQGVTTVFGVPGESYLAVIDALRDTDIRLVSNRHEGGAAFMAEAWGKLTGEPGIVFVTRGPGATNAAIGVHSARQASTPMILFVGQIARGMRDREAFQEVDYRAAFGPVAKWATEIDDAARIPEIVARAFATARSGRPGPVVIALPEDMLVETPAAVPGPRVRVPFAAPPPEALAELAGRLAAARAPLVLVGGGGWTERARDGLRSFAEGLGLPVLAAWRRHDLMANDSPSFVGHAGLGKPAYVARLFADADLLLAINVRFGEITTDGWDLLQVPHPAAAGGPAVVHTHASDLELNRTYTADLPVHAHPDALMPALAALKVTPGAGWPARTAAARAAWAAELLPPAQSGDLDMAAVVRHLDETLPDDAILTGGAGNFAIWLAKHFRYPGRRRLLAPQSGAMGYGLPAAIAARVARPEATVVCLAGDGDLQMTLAELGAAMQADARPIVLVVNNRSYGTIRMHQERAYPGRVAFTDIENPDFVAIARAYGLHAERVTRTAEFADALARARASTTGALLDLVVDTEAIAPRLTISALRARG